MPATVAVAAKLMKLLRVRCVSNTVTPSRPDLLAELGTNRPPMATVLSCASL
jgi:hypothetical protein